jgi:hypothetical protein
MAPNMSHDMFQISDPILIKKARKSLLTPGVIKPKKQMLN